MLCQEICFNRISWAQSEGGAASEVLILAFGSIPMLVTLKSISQ